MKNYVDYITEITCKLLAIDSPTGYTKQAAEFVMEETQIRYHAYSPWNGARKTRDAERLVILPGSVIVVRSANPPDPDILKNGVGIFRSEGFGEVLCNPAFLFCKSLAEGENRTKCSTGNESPGACNGGRYSQCGKIDPD